MAVFGVTELHREADEGTEKEVSFRRVMRVTERTTDKKGQALLIPEIELLYNILRFIGQLNLVTNRGIIRHPAKRRRIKTVAWHDMRPGEFQGQFTE